MAAGDVIRFLTDQNRPVSLNDIIQAVGQKHDKSSVQKAVDKLVEEEKIFVKTYAKQKIFCVVQEDRENAGGGEELRILDKDIEEVSGELKTVENELCKRSCELKDLEGKITVEEAQVKASELGKDIAVLRGKLEKFNSKGSESVSPGEKNKLWAEYERCSREYRKRKRMCTDIVNMIMEGYPKSKKHLVEDVGIETDEDAGFNPAEHVLK